METTNRRAVIYCRVSTKEQVEEGNSLATQEKICKEYALKNGYDIIEKFIEQGESAKTQNRPELQRLLKYCKDEKNKVVAVIAYKIDRISRNTDDYSQIRMALKRDSVDIISTSEFFEDTPAGRFMHNMIATVSQFDNDVRTERSVNGMKDAAAEGRYVWLSPIGYSNMRINGKSTIAQNEMAPLVRQTFEEIAKNLMPVEEIRKRMIEEGLRNKKGKPISKSYFYTMVTNPVYAGWIIKFGQKHRGLFEPIVSDELFDQVAYVLRHRKRKSYQYIKENPDFPLRRFITHPSGRKLTGCWSQGRHKKYPYYRFHEPVMEFKKEVVEENFKEFMNAFELNEKHYAKLRLQVQKHLIKGTAKGKKDLKRIESYVSDLHIKQNALIEKNIKGIISDKILQQQLEIVEKELFNSRASIQNIPIKDVDIETSFNQVSEYLKSPGTFWEGASFESKMQLQWFTFPFGVTFDGTNCRTAEIHSLFKAKSVFLPPKSSRVHLSNNTSHNPDITNQEYWNQIALEIKELAAIIKKAKEVRMIEKLAPSGNSTSLTSN